MSQSTTPQYSETNSLWIAALILPLVVLLSGSLIAFLCWRRLRSNNSSLRASKQLKGTPSSSQDTSDSPPSSKSNSVLQYPRPLFLARSSSALIRPVHRPHHLPSLSKASFPSVSTTVNSQGSRVIVRKGRKNWPPAIGWPIQLQSYYPTDEEPRRVPGMGQQGGTGGEEGRNENETDLHRGISQVTGYNSNSHPHPHHPYHRSLVEEASNTRHSWSSGDDASIHFSSLPRPLPPLRTRSLSSRSISEYSNFTVGATTLGRLLDEEIDRVARQQHQQAQFDRSATPGVPLVATSSTRPLDLSRPLERPQSSADLYSLHPIAPERQFIPFSRLPPIALTDSQDLPSTPSPLPREDDVKVNTSRDATNRSMLSPLESTQSVTPQVKRERKESGRQDGRSWLEWRNGKMEERRKEREEVMRK